MIGKCPVAVVKIVDVNVQCILDSGSEVSTITEEFFNKHFKSKGQDLLSASGWLTLTAANGLKFLTLAIWNLTLLCLASKYPNVGYWL